MKSFSLFILSALIFCGCQAKSPANDASNSGEITVSAAVSLKDAFNEIGEMYKQKTGVKVSFNYGASGTLQKQIEAGAPADVFASAGAKQVDELNERGKIDAESRRNFAKNTLVLIVPKDSKLDVSSFPDLAKSTVQKIAAGNPKTVPVGQYTEQLFTKMNLKDNIQPKLVLAEDVRQVLDYASRGEVDAGIVYATDARAAGDKVRVVATASADSHDPIFYPIAVLKDGKQKKAAQAFVTLVLSPEGQTVLQKYGFGNASEK